MPAHWQLETQRAWSISNGMGASASISAPKAEKSSAVSTEKKSCGISNENAFDPGRIRQRFTYRAPSRGEKNSKQQTVQDIDDLIQQRRSLKKISAIKASVDCDSSKILQRPGNFHAQEQAARKIQSQDRDISHWSDEEDDFSVSKAHRHHDLKQSKTLVQVLRNLASRSALGQNV